MSKIKTIIKAFFILSSLAGISALSSCTYTPIEDDPIDLSGYVTTVIEGNKTPIPYIVVELINLDSPNNRYITYTETTGFFIFENIPQGDWTLRFTDTDGSKNVGSFEQKEKEIEISKSRCYDGDSAITLTKKNNS